MSEQTCEHNYSGGIWTVTLRNGDMIVDAHGCPDCLTRLEEGGTETRMVPAVEIEAVRETRLYRLLSAIASKPQLADGGWGDAGFVYLGTGLAMQEIGIACLPSANTDYVHITDEGRVLLAALSQTAGLAAECVPITPAGDPPCDRNTLRFCPQSEIPCPRNIVVDYECEGRDDGLPCDDPRVGFGCWERALCSMAWHNWTAEGGDTYKHVETVTADAHPWMGNVSDGYRQMCRREAEWQKKPPALSQTAGLAAAEWLALKYGRFVYLERLGFPDEYDAEACERAASEIAKKEMDAALAAVGAETGQPSHYTVGVDVAAGRERDVWTLVRRDNDGILAVLAIGEYPVPEPGPSDTELLDALEQHDITSTIRSVGGGYEFAHYLVGKGQTFIARAETLRELARKVLAASQPAPSSPPASPRPRRAKSPNRGGSFCPRRPVPTAAATPATATSASRRTTMPRLTDAQIAALPEEFRGLATHINFRLSRLPGDEDMAEVSLGAETTSSLLSALAEARTAVGVLADQLYFHECVPRDSECPKGLPLDPSGHGATDCGSCPYNQGDPRGAWSEYAYAQARAKLAEEEDHAD